MPGMKWCLKIKMLSQLVRRYLYHLGKMCLGEYGDKFYVILEGLVSVLVPSKVKKQVDE
jgi:hypothetical protein